MTIFHKVPESTQVKVLSPTDIGPLFVNNDNLLSSGFKVK